MISRYLELIPLSLWDIQKQLWDVPEHDESFTWLSAQVKSCEFKNIRILVDGALLL